MLTRRILRDERGGVLALSAVLIPVFIIFIAMAVDVGTWFTHKRQLQNRADAAALAAGVEYAARWSACGDPATKTAAATAIATQARTYGGDPQTGGTLRNTEVTEQARVNVEINAPPALAGDVDPDTSWDDTGIVGGLGPCDTHPPDAISPNPNSIWTQVGVRERDQPSLFGSFGLPLSRNRAWARVELQPAEAGKGFIPVAIPEQDILQAQIRYLNYCDPANPTLMAKATLRRVGTAFQKGGTNETYWAPTIGDVMDGTPNGVAINMPAATDCGGGAGPYIPVVAEVRVASVATSIIDIDSATCQQLITASFADCWSGLSNIRVFKDNPTTEPWFQEATIGGGTCAPDGYFAVTDPTTTCTFSGSVVIDFNDIGGSSPPAGRVDVSIAGQQASYSGSTFPDGLWTMNGTANNSASGRSNVSVSWCVHPTSVNCRTSGGNQDPHGSTIVHAMYRNNEIAPLLTMVHTSGGGPDVNGNPGSILDWFRAQPSATATTLFPTVGLQSSIKVGQRRILRLSTSQITQSLDCEPNTGGQGHEWSMFLTGCDPWYTENTYTGPPWWFPGTSPPPGKCPNLQGIAAQPNAPDNAWQCVPKASNAFSPSVIGDGAAGAIGNCSNPQPNACQQYACTNPNYYDPNDPNRWALVGGEASPRVVFLFIVPYAAYKNTGSQDGLPVLNFAAFYITGWHGQAGTSGQNPCEGTDPDGPGPARPDEPAQPGEIIGYFVGWTFPSGPSDPHAACQVGQLRPCVPVLVR